MLSADASWRISGMFEGRGGHTTALLVEGEAILVAEVVDLLLFD